MKYVYVQVRIDDYSANLCTFGTPLSFSRYQFCRLPFGLCLAPNVFQNKNYKIFGDINCVGLYFDDIIVTDKNKIKYDNNLMLVFQRAQKCGIKFNSKKCTFNSTQVKFMIQVCSKNRVEPNIAYVKAMTDIPVPKDEPEV